MGAPATRRRGDGRSHAPEATEPRRVPVAATNTAPATVAQKRRPDLIHFDSEELDED